MSHDNQRRNFLLNSAKLGVGGLCFYAVAGAAEALDKKVPAEEVNETKIAFHFQDHPNGPLRCAQCVFFVPSEPNSLTGACRVIDGEVTANSWCQAYRPKPVNVK